MSKRKNPVAANHRADLRKHKQHYYSEALGYRLLQLQHDGDGVHLGIEAHFLASSNDGRQQKGVRV
jgi:hypothetical protein